MEQTAATLEQLTATINNTAGNTAQVYQFVTETTAIVKQNGVVMSEVSSRMQEIYDTSSEMTAIIRSSTGLPSRPTFSRLMLPWKPHAPASPAVDLVVVAGEVRNLAQRSASAAREIKELIDDSVSALHPAVPVEKADRKWRISSVTSRAWKG